MKLIIARLLSVFTACTLLFILFINVFSLNAASISSNKKIHFQKHQVSENITKFFEDIEEDEEDIQDLDFVTDNNSFQQFDNQGFFILKESKTNLLSNRNNSTTSIPKWLFVRHILL
jgi:hypothetical protein